MYKDSHSLEKIWENSFTCFLKYDTDTRIDKINRLLNIERYKYLYKFNMVKLSNQREGGKEGETDYMCIWGVCVNYLICTFEKTAKLFGEKNRKIVKCLYYTLYLNKLQMNYHLNSFNKYLLNAFYMLDNRDKAT